MPLPSNKEDAMNFIKIVGTMADRFTHRDVRVDREGRLIPTPSVEGTWQTATIDKGGTSTRCVDLLDAFMYMRVIIPTIDSATIKVTVAETPGSTFYNLDAVTTPTGTHNYATTFKIGGYRYIKLVASASQTTAAIACRVSGLGGV